MTTLITLVEVLAYDPSRPNLVGYPRAFDNAAWTKIGATVSADAATSHDNRVLADKLVESAANELHAIEQLASGITTGQVVQSAVMVKAAGRTRIRLEAGGTAGAGTVDFNLSTGTVIASSGIATGSQVIAYGGGWFRCAAAWTASGNGTMGVRVVLADSAAYGIAYAGDGSSGVYLDRALLEVAGSLGDFIDNEGAAGPGLVTLRYSSYDFITGASDTPPHVAFQNRIITAPDFTRKILSDFRVMGGGEAGAGLLELANADHALSSLLDLGLDGRMITVYIGEAGDAFPGGWTVWLTGSVEQVEISNARGTATMRLRDRTAILDTPLQDTHYAGDNTLPNGAEGVATDLKDRNKPSGWGRCYHAPCPLVNTALLIYQANDGVTQAIDAVYDKGAALVASGSNRADLAALEAATIAAGEYDTCLSLGLFRLGGSAAGKVTADIQGDASGSGYVSRAGAIVRRILEDRAGVATADIDTAAFAALDADVNYEVGYWTAEEVTCRDAINAICASVGAWIVPSRAGMWTIGRLTAPSGTPDYTITDDDILDIDRIATNDRGRGVPVWRVELRYNPWWTAFADGDLVAVPGITEAIRAQLLQPWRTAASEDAAVKTTHLLATQLNRNALLTVKADADAEAARLQALYGVRRDYVRLRLPLTTTYAGIDFTHVIRVTTPALGYGAGRDFRPVRITRDAQFIDLDLWG